VKQNSRQGALPGKRRNSPYRSGRSRDWIKSKNPNAPAVKRKAEED
jgi:ATP-dependent DNA ligase